MANEIKWDHESDVVIIGGGTAGLPAAIKVQEAGQKATILEWRPQCGGSLGMIVGSVAFAGSDEQKAAGIEDSPELLTKDLIAVELFRNCQGYRRSSTGSLRYFPKGKF
jgi:fumarate reductase flavoprotein subunit